MADLKDQIDKLRWIKKHLELSMTHLGHLELELGRDDEYARDRVVAAWQACSAIFSLLYDIEHALGCEEATGASGKDTGPRDLG